MRAAGSRVLVLVGAVVAIGVVVAMTAHYEPDEWVAAVAPVPTSRPTLAAPTTIAPILTAPTSPTSTSTSTTSTTSTTAAPAPVATKATVTTPTTAAAPRPAPTTTTVAAPRCHPSYVGECLPVGAVDVDCAGGGGNGPVYAYTKNIRVVGPDVYGLDRDGDGIGCES